MKRKRPQSTKPKESLPSLEKDFPIPKTGWIRYISKFFRGITLLSLLICFVFLIDAFLPTKTVNGEIKFIEELEEKIYVHVDDIYFLIDAPPLNYFNQGDNVNMHLSPILGILYRVSIKDFYFGERVSRPFGNRIFGIGMLIMLILLFSFFILRNKRAPSTFDIAIGAFQLLFLWFLYIQFFSWPRIINF